MSKTDIPPKFKAGEIVILNLGSNHRAAEHDGKQGTIVGKGVKGWIVHLAPLGVLELSEQDLLSIGEEIERLGRKEKTVPPFNPGDIVYRKGPGHHSGDIGTIEEGHIFDTGAGQVQQWSVRFPNGRGGFDHVYVPNSHLRLATEEEAKKAMESKQKFQPKRDVPRKRYEDPDPAERTARQKEARQISDIERKMRAILGQTEDDPI